MLVMVAHAQTVQITGTVLDPTGKAYQNGSGSVVLVPQNVNFLVNGTNPVQSPVIINALDSFGKFSVTLTNTSLISPSSSNPQWQFRFCSQTFSVQPLPVCFTMTPLSLTSNQDISSQIQAQSALLPFTGGILTLQTNGTPNGSQTLLNLAQTSPITVTDNGSGTVHFACPTCVLGSGNNGQVAFWAGSTLTGDPSFQFVTGGSSATLTVGLSSATTGAIILSNSTNNNVIVLTQTSQSTGGGTLVFPAPLGGNGIFAVNATSPIVEDTSGTISCPTCATTGGAQYKKLRCESGLGDGLNAMAAGTYLQFMCVNDSGVTWTITGIHCWTDNAGTSTLNAANNAATALLTGAVTCNSTKASGGAAGTQSGTTTLASGDAVSFTFVADGTSKQTTWTMSLSQ